ncbi:MAG: aryl-sulfate sulfotransferase, partial [Bacteroidetes bacterium]|nr:aryl-sulfate sulfotransferase [Bacteroidota bacterium]
LGGVKSRNNQFQFINDTRTFSHQHDIRRLSNGHVSMYDNGSLLIPQYSRALEYELDENNNEATLVWKFSYDPPVYKNFMGNMQRLSNGNTIIGWGGYFSSDRRAISEVGFDGSVALEVSLPDSFTNYQAFKFPWKTNLFVTKPDSIFFESVPVGDSATISVDLINNSADPVDITGYYNVNEDYVVENPVPFTLPAFGTVSLNIKFIPGKDGYFKDYLHIRSDTETSRVAQVMILAGRTDTIFSDVKKDEIIYNYVLEQNYPNPFNPGTTIRYSIPTQSNVRLRVYNSIGENIADLINSNQSAGIYEVSWNAGNVASGIYFYSIEAIPTDGTDYFHSVKKMILLK